MKAFPIVLSFLLLFTLGHLQAQESNVAPKVLKVKISDTISAPATQLRTNIVESKYSKGKIKLKAKYGGGCKEHAFEIQSTGKPDNQGVLHLYLLDQTTDDYCKAFKFADLLIDVKALFKKLPKHFKMQINQSEVVAISR